MLLTKLWKAVMRWQAKEDCVSSKQYSALGKKGAG